ncbi:FAD-NAD(P)-binding [Pseudonocardia thermophila]|uniref:FAD-NAD(P)-binding n=1 Tax=Pseudonocardia thermophila TaxID=1848 RepID=A0A1M7A4R3_PSETH|nr:FAD/NAD(P)-binding protein [Pseudonocardia thermophila]SHL37724.1 FAD-NAD(P)-binding [Pseudonocardia thermophila]
MPAIAVIGAGPRGTGILERLAANHPELGGGPLDVHLIDPYPPGAGRIWRHAQSPLLAMNSMAADVTMYTDESVVCEGPIRPGPSFWDWAREHADPAAFEPELAAELRSITASSFPSRRLQSRYLEWVLADLLAHLPDGVRVHFHRTRAIGLADDGAAQVVELEEGAPLRVDAVVLASGHLDATPTDDELALLEHARQHGLVYLPPEQTSDSDLSVLVPGETVLVRGMGLAFIDLLVLLYEGRGGRFEPEGDGLRYVPSGQEPYIVAGSPRGMPYHAKTHYDLRGGPPPLPRFLGDAQVGAFLDAGEPIDLRRQVWPLMAKEIAWGWYHELFQGHPDRVRLPWAEFAEAFAAADWDGPEMRALIEHAVPDPVDRIDLAALHSPLAGVIAPDLDALQPIVRAKIAEDLRQHVDPAHTPHLGAFVAMLSVYAQAARIMGSGLLTPRSEAEDVSWWQGFFNGVASGPPGFRVRELLALSEAGFVRFLGAGMAIEAVPEGFRATSATLPTAPPVQARALVEARLPDPSASRSTDALLASLVRAGEVVEAVIVDHDDTVLRNTGQIRTRPSDGAIVDATGRVHPRRFAAGPHTTVKLPGAFTRPGTNSLSFRHNDALARAVLKVMTGASQAAA